MRRVRSYSPSAEAEGGEQGFWPSYADMMSAVALILFFLMLLSYIQNLITGNDLQNTQEVLANTRDQVTQAQIELEALGDELNRRQLEIDGYAIQIVEQTETIAARLADEGLQFELSVSLHAPNDALRNELMPVNRKWPMAELLAACREYTLKTKRIITFEYTVIGGVNESRACAEELARRVREVPMAKVNLIPLSPVSHRPDLETPDEATQLAFLDVLMKAHVQTMLRRSRGKDADAACGQLRLRNGMSGH